MELPGQRPVHVVVVDVERVSKVGDWPARDLDACVNLLATVAAREAHREAAGRLDRRRAGRDRDVLYIHVTVLNHGVAAHGAPHDVPGPHLLAVEAALDARALECLGHHAVERAVPADRNGAGPRPEGGEDTGKYAIAFLPVGTRHVKG